MAPNQANLDFLWKRVEDARHQWKLAHQCVKEVDEDRAAMPAADGSYAHLSALSAQHRAVDQYLRALQEFKAALALENAANGAAPAVQNVLPTAGITPREREVLSLIASGRTSKEIAVELGMAFRTAVCHRYRLYQKLKVHSNVELTRIALQMGLVEL